MADDGTQAVLLRRSGLVFVEPAGGASSDDCVRAVDLDLAALGYAATTRLRQRLAQLGPGELAAWRDRTCAVLAARLGADRKHEPLFRHFPDDVPPDTTARWIARVLTHFFQAEGQRCIFCRRTGTTHVLSPCRDVVCDHCFDGGNYSACPVCERPVDRTSPFFEPSPPRGAPDEKHLTFELLDLGDHVDDAAAAAVRALCERPQPMSPADRDDLTTLVRDAGIRALAWLPPEIPVKENIAIVFGTLFRACPPDDVLPAARAHLRTATDVLRFVAVWSAADPSLQGDTRLALEQAPDGQWRRRPRTTYRFRVSRIPRPVRRALLALLDGMGFARLAEDMLRHQSYWVWLGEFLHPHEYASRFPAVARAFAIVRTKAPDGTPAPPFATFHARVETAIAHGDAIALTALLRQRPGELARRYDHALRIAGDDPRALECVTTSFVDHVQQMTTPVLLTLRTSLPTRTRPAPIRVFWPKGGTARTASAADTRPPLRADAIAPVIRAIDVELLRRFAALPAFEEAIIDASLADIVVPFNERTASRGAVQLPRGSRLALAPSKVLRLFLHWCQPSAKGYTDLDLSVGFFDATWHHVGVCSYYQLDYRHTDGRRIAASAGDMQGAPPPDGATEFVDVHRDVARAAGIRYAAVLINAYRGLSFSQLERAYAGLMLRDDTLGSHFDPRTVELNFELQGESGMFMPLVVDLDHDTLHWLDVYAKGGLEFNNVATSEKDIKRLAPNLMSYFASGVRPTMFELARLHAAARCHRVVVRGPKPGEHHAWIRGAGETAAHFVARMATTRGDVAARPRFDRPVFAALLRGNLALPAGSSCYALFRDRVTSPLSAADLLA
jgi:hypothetical protein